MFLILSSCTCGEEKKSRLHLHEKKKLLSSSSNRKIFRGKSEIGSLTSLASRPVVSFSFLFLIIDSPQRVKL